MALAGLIAVLVGGAPFAARAIAPARDPNIAVREEYEAALAAGTAAALREFIDRHPDHALAARARRRLRKMNGR